MSKPETRHGSARSERDDDATSRRTFVKGSILAATAAVAAAAAPLEAQQSKKMMERPTDVLIQKVSTGDVVVFDKKRRELIVIDQAAVAEWEAVPDKSWAAARTLVGKSKAQYFDRKALQKIQAALAGIVLLAVPTGPS